MATAEEIAAFRLLINQPINAAPYTDEALSDRLDLASSVQSLASIIWSEMAASYASMVNVSESGSSRSLSDLHKNAIAMAKYFSDNDPTTPGTGEAVRGVRMHRLTR